MKRRMRIEEEKKSPNFVVYLLWLTIRYAIVWRICLRLTIMFPYGLVLLENSSGLGKSDQHYNYGLLESSQSNNVKNNYFLFQRAQQVWEYIRENADLNMLTVYQPTLGYSFFDSCKMNNDEKNLLMYFH